MAYSNGSLANTGTLLLADLIANKQTTPAAFGLDTIAQIVANDLAVHNRLTNDMVAEFADVSGDRLRLSGASGNMDMYEIDETSRTRTQKTLGGQSVGFPLRLFGVALGWDRQFFKRKTVADMAVQVQNAEAAHIRRIRTDLQRAIYRSGNYTFRDELGTPQVDLPVKRLANADGFPIPNGPNGETFDPTVHTHYLAATSLTAGALTSLVQTVAEHSNASRIRVAINIADEVAVRALAGFIPYVDARLTLNTAANQPDGTRLDTTRTNDRAIGLFGAAEVWVKPWAIAFYPVAYDTAANEKPLVYRTGVDGVGSGLAIAAELDDYPLTAQHMEAELGFGVWGRVSAAVLQTNAATVNIYVDPI